MGEPNGPGFEEMPRGHRGAARLALEQLAEVSGVSVRALSDMSANGARGLRTGPLPPWRTR